MRTQSRLVDLKHASTDAHAMAWYAFTTTDLVDSSAPVLRTLQQRATSEVTPPAPVPCASSAAEAGPSRRRNPAGRHMTNRRGSPACSQGRLRLVCDPGPAGPRSLRSACAIECRRSWRGSWPSHPGELITVRQRTAEPGRPELATHGFRYSSCSTHGRRTRPTPNLPSGGSVPSAAGRRRTILAR